MISGPMTKNERNISNTKSLIFYIFNKIFDQVRSSDVSINCLDRIERVTFNNNFGNLMISLMEHSFSNDQNFNSYDINVINRFCYLCRSCNSCISTNEVDCRVLCVLILNRRILYLTQSGWEMSNFAT